jgi:hypothetical protein
VRPIRTTLKWGMGLGLDGMGSGGDGMGSGWGMIGGGGICLFPANVNFLQIIGNDLVIKSSPIYIGGNAFRGRS